MEFDLLYLAEHSQENAFHTQDIVRDLKLPLILDAMACGEKDVYDACAQVLTHPLADVLSIRLRNEIVRDAVLNPELFESLHRACCDGLRQTEKLSEFTKPKYDKVIRNANKIVNETEIAQIYLKALKSLKALLGSSRQVFTAADLKRLCDTVVNTLDGEYLERMQKRIDEMAVLRQGAFVSLNGFVGDGLKMKDAVLNCLCDTGKKSRAPLGTRGVLIPLSSITLIQNAQEITENALLPVLKVISGFNRSAQDFLKKLAFQIKFYIGCARLYGKLKALHAPLCYPVFSENGVHMALELVDTGLAIKEGFMPAGNELSLSGKRLAVITGPNQGGKTTYLRSIGLAQMMAQCGMFVSAREYVCPMYTGIFTHFPNGEDTGMKMGLLEVELSRLNGLVHCMRSGALLLVNEAFQTTTPGDAKNLATMIIPALCDSGVRVVFVTHLYAYAKELYDLHLEEVLFLKAQRNQLGKNTYQILEGEPFRSAFGLQLFNEVMEKLASGCEIC